MKCKPFLFILATVSILSFQSCLSFSNLVEAEGIGKGTKTLQATTDLSVFLEPAKGNVGFWPAAEFQFAYGVTDKIDLRTTLSSNDYLSVSGKYHILHRENYDLGLGGTIDIGIINQRQPHGGLDIYYTLHKPKWNIMINPFVHYNTSTIVSNLKGYGFIYGISSGFGSRNEKHRNKFALNLAFIPDGEFHFNIGIGVAHEIRWKKK